MLLILISNKIDLNVYESRLGTNALVFVPYNCRDMIRIAENMVSEMKVFEDKAIEYAIKKVAICSSDIRRLLHLLMLAIRICMEESKISGDCLVSLSHIEKAFANVYRNAAY